MYKPMPQLTPEQQRRFHESINTGDGDECWEWRGTKLTDGRTQFCANYKKYTASRVAYWLATGVDPKELYVCHKCDNPLCCNPSHLWLGTTQDNTSDRHTKKRDARQLGERHGCSRLTEDKVREIRKETGTQSKIATRYGIDQSTVSLIVRRRIWRHVL